jgi:ketosteroid isomerase-like protein
MHKLVLALAITALAVRPVASPPDAAVMASINQFLEAFNNGDVKAANAVCSDITEILDDFAPYEWHGAGTCATWMAAYDADAKVKGITDPHVTFGAPRHLDVAGDHAYVVLPSDYVYKEKGKPVHESESTITITLKKGATGWRMTGWAWSKH